MCSGRVGIHYLGEGLFIQYSNEIIYIYVMILLFLIFFFKNLHLLMNKYDNKTILKKIEPTFVIAYIIFLRMFTF
jgi:hypothetical protein